MSWASVTEKLRAGLLFLIFSVVAGLMAGALAVPTLLVGSVVVNTASTEFEQIPLDLITPPQPLASKVYMADGSLLAKFSDEYREYVTIDRISPWMQKAQVAIEDKRFYDHGAVDPIGMLRAAIGPLLGESQRGASSITQQYVKLVRVQIAIQNKDKAAQKAATEISLSRKIIEMRYAMALEKKMTKDQILEAYLNMAYYGDQSYGVQAAAYHYFGVSAEDLTLPQAAMLAGLVQAPGATTPTRNPVTAVNRRDVVLNAMAEPDINPRLQITTQQRDEAKAVEWDPAGVRSISTGCQDTRYPFICDYVWRTLYSTKMAAQFGDTEEERKNAVRTGGYDIYTVIDPVAQNQAQWAVNNRIDPRDPAIAVSVLIQPGTGLIISMAQSRPVMGTNKAKGETFWNYAVPYNMGGAEGFQGGSTFKVFVLAYALSIGVPLNTTYTVQAPMDFSGYTFKSCSGPVRASNYKVRGGSGTYNLLTATASSVNSYYLSLERDTSICGAVKMAQAAGLKLAKAVTSRDKKTMTTDLIKAGYDAYPAFTLGVPEVAPLSMAEAYATFAAGGKHCDPIILKSITDRNGNEVPVPSANCQQTIDKRVAAGVSLALQGVMAYGTGTVARIPGGWPLAGKSGTTTNATAVAFAGYTPYVAGFATIAVDKTNPWWNGRRHQLSHQRMPYSGTYMSGTGAPDAGQIWKVAMAAAIRNTPKVGFPHFTPIPGHWSSPYTGKTPSPTATTTAPPPPPHTTGVNPGTTTAPPPPTTTTAPPPTTTAPPPPPPPPPTTSDPPPPPSTTP